MEAQLVLACLLFAAIGLELANPQILRVFIDQATQGAEIDRLIGIALLFLAVAVATQVVAIVETYVAENVGLTATNALRADLTLHCLRLDPGFHSQHTPGELIERVDGDVNTLANFFSRFVVQVVGNALLMVGVLVLLLQIDWRVGLVMASRRSSALIAAEPPARSGRAALGGCAPGQRRVVRLPRRAAGGHRRHPRQRRHRLRDAPLPRALAPLLRRELAGRADRQPRIPVGSHAADLRRGAGARAGRLPVPHRAISLGSVYLIFAYTQVLNRPIEQITRQMQDLQQAGAGLRRIQQFFGWISSLADGQRDLPPGPLAVELDRVSFGYVADEPSCTTCRFDCRRARCWVCWVAPAAARARWPSLLLRLYDPSAGASASAGVDLRDVPLVGAASARGHGHPGHPTLPRHRPRQPDLVRLQRADARHARRAGRARARRLAAPPVRTASTRGWRQTAAGCRPARPNCWPSPASSCAIPAWSSSTRPRRVWTRRPTAHRARRRSRLLADRTGIVIAHRLATIERVDQVLILDSHGVREWGSRARRCADDPSSAFVGAAAHGRPGAAGVSTWRAVLAMARLRLVAVCAERTAGPAALIYAFPLAPGLIVRQYLRRPQRRRDRRRRTCGRRWRYWPWSRSLARS